MCAYWILTNSKNGVSSCELARSIGVTQKSAWFMLHRIRMNLKEDATIKTTGTGTKDKVAVMGILERGGKVRTAVVPTRRKAVLQAEVRKHVEAGSALYTDFLLSYDGLAADYALRVVDHAVEYVNGRIHTNGLENFWSLLKRGIHGTYVSIEPFHLFRYLDEQTFRYNNRKNMDDQARFELAMSNVAGKRLTYSELTGATLAH